MTDRLRHWLVACIAAMSVLGVTVAWTAYLYARSTPHWQQSEPGAFADPLPEGGMPMRLASLTVTPILVTDRGEQPAPAGALWVLAVIEYQPPPQGGSCILNLLAVDGRQWGAVSPLDVDGERPLDFGCTATPGSGTPRAEHLYLIPEDAAGSLAGLVGIVSAHRGTSPYTVLTPPAAG